MAAVAVTVSIKRMSAGSGYQYLMRSVAAADGARRDAQSLTAYYTEKGNPPGRWAGRGLAGLCEELGVEAGSMVSERQMFHLFGMGEDPVTGQALGRCYRQPTADGKSGGVAGFDVTFSAPKSVSVWWALADPATREAIAVAHHAAIEDTVNLLEREVAATRVGTNGVAQVAVRGIVAASFDHWDSRAGDPQLHTHLVVANRVQDAAGVWRTLDSKALYRSTVALSEFYNATLADRLTRDLGATWEPVTRKHSAVPKWEVEGVPTELMEAFSQRSAAIEGEKDGLVERFAREHGRQPTAVEAVRLRQQATLATRPEKDVHSLAELVQQWRERAEEVLGRDATGWLRDVKQGRHQQAEEVLSTADLAVRVLAEVQAKRSTWGRWNVHAEATRQLAGVRFDSAAERERATDAVVAAALAGSLVLTVPELAHTPAAFRRPDGASQFRHRDTRRFSSIQLIEAEARLLDASRDLTGPTASPPRDRSPAVAPLGEDQAAAVESIASSGRVLDVLVGPAGAGKTTALAALRRAWEAEHGPGSVVGLASSATASDVLAAELGIATENTAKWLAEQQKQTARQAKVDTYQAQMRRLERANHRAAQVRAKRLERQSAEADRWRLGPGQLVIIDEASLAGTLALDAITTQAQAAGAKVLLVGDWAQLDAVEAGGAFALLARDRPGVAELGTVRRFANSWEAAASTRLREGDADVLEEYVSRGRVRHGGDVLEQALRAWSADEAAGQTSLLIAGDAATVLELNQRARAGLVAAGQVACGNGSVPLPDGTRVAAGDRVVTRKNDRLLSTGRGFVKNGDRWLVTDAHADGSLSVRRPTGGAAIRLPAGYVAEHVELGYATTAHRAQGATVDTAHLVVTESMTREVLYVGMTRARHANTAYVLTDPIRADHHDLVSEPPRTAREVLTAVLGRVGAELSAHEAMRAEQDQAAIIAQLADEYDTIAAVADRPRWTRLLAPHLNPAQLENAQASTAFGALAKELRAAEGDGLPVEQSVPSLIRSRQLDDAEDVASVLHERVTRWAATQPQQPIPRNAIARLIPKATGVTDPELQRGLREREALIEQRADALLAAALTERPEWLQRLGPPPADERRRRLWTVSARTVAAYRDRQSDAERRHDDGTAERRRVEAAVRLARSLADTPSPTSESIPTRDLAPRALER